MNTGSSIIDVLVHAHFGKSQSEFPIPDQLLRDRRERDSKPSLDTVAHMFGDPGDRDRIAGDPRLLADAMRAAGIEAAQITLYGNEPPELLDALSAEGSPFFATLRVDPQEGYPAIQRLESLARNYPIIRSVSIMPAILYPPISAGSPEFYPVYVKCIELGLPIMINVGFPGPRVPGDVQNPMHLEKVAWFYPELTIVMKHGGVPWADVCVALLRKWPNLYYATTAFTPRRYPSEVMAYMRQAKAHKVIYGGYYPALDFRRSVDELATLKLDDEVADRFLRGNARDVFKIGTI